MAFSECIKISSAYGSNLPRFAEDFACHKDCPLAVDLNGTLISVDTLHEGFISAFKNSPSQCAMLLKTIRQGKASFKRNVAGASGFDPTLLPYNEGLLGFLKEQKQRGRRIGLFTAAHQSIAKAVAEHLDIFDVVRGSDDLVNLSGQTKLDAIREAFGQSFTYAGNGGSDQPIFAAAESVLLVGPVTRLKRGLMPGKAIEAAFPSDSSPLRVWAKALRLDHWAKNTLVLVGPLLGFELGSPHVLGQSLLLFFALGLLASATYLINDLFDLTADRQHPVKRFRPFASGKIPVRDGLFAAVGLVVAALTASLALPLGCTLSLVGYLAVTLAYSFALKRQPMADVLVLAFLFTVRIVAGGFLLTVPISPWLLTFSMLFFLGLAIVKRYAELDRVVRLGGEGAVPRGYTASDLPLLLAMGVGSGLSAIGIFVIYLINEHYPQAIYRHPEALWAMMPILLLWTMRVWRITVHGRMNEDPIVFALKDRTSLFLGALVGATLILAWS
jgi:4-hydroxybenzoate polyprenyltransferase